MRANQSEDSAPRPKTRRLQGPLAHVRARHAVRGVGEAWWTSASNTGSGSATPEPAATEHDKEVEAAEPLRESEAKAKLEEL